MTFENEPESYMDINRVMQRERAAQETGSSQPPFGLWGCPDKEAKPAFLHLLASQGNEPETGRSPMESWKQALQWYSGKSLDGD